MKQKYSKPSKHYEHLYDVSRSAIDRWKRAGLPLDDEAEMERIRCADGLGGKGRSAENLEGIELKEAVLRAELRKRLKQCQEIELRVARQRGELIETCRVQDSGPNIGVVVKQGLLRLENDLPPQLEGLKAAKMKGVLRQQLRELLRTWSDYAGEEVDRLTNEAPTIRWV